MRPTLPYLTSQFKLAEYQIALPVGSFVQVLPSNTNRYAIVFCSTFGGQVNLSRNPNATGNGSLTLANAANASMQDLILTFSDVGPLVGDAWFACALIAGQVLGINEIMYLPT